MERKMKYTVWSYDNKENYDCEELTQAEAFERFGETTIKALEIVARSNPKYTAALHGIKTELLVECDPDFQSMLARHLRACLEPQQLTHGGPGRDRNAH